MKQTIKILFIFIIAISLSASPAYSIGEIINNADDAVNIPTGEEVLNTTKMQDVIAVLYDIGLTIASIAAVLIGTIIGIRFLLASAGEKAEIKESLVPFLLGCVIVFGAFGIWRLAIMIGNQL